MVAGQNLPPPFFERGDTIGRILVIEFNDQDSSVFDEVMAVLKHHSVFEQLRFNEEDVLSLPGLEIYPDRRKIYRNRREINLTAKEYDLLCLLVANKGRVLTYEQIYQRIWGEELLGNESNTIGCHIRNLREKLYEAAPDKALASLPEKQRNRISSHFLLGMSLSEIAKSEGSAVSSVHEGIQRGLRRLKKILEEME